MSKPQIKTFQGTDLQLLEKLVNEFCRNKWIYDIQLQAKGEEVIFMVVYMDTNREV